MNEITSLFLAIGITAFAYTKLSRRTGNGNMKSILVILAVTFFITLVVAYTLFRFVIHLS